MKKINDETNFLSLKIIISILGIDRTRGLIFSKFDPKYKKNVEILNFSRKLLKKFISTVNILRIGFCLYSIKF